MLNAEHFPREKKTCNEYGLTGLKDALSVHYFYSLRVIKCLYYKKFEDNFFCILPCVSLGAVSERIMSIKVFEVKAVGPVLLPDPLYSMSPF